MLAGVLLALAVWAVAAIHAAEPVGGAFTLVDSALAPERRDESK